MKIGIIGGSGLYEIEGMSDVKEIKIDTPFGEPSDSITTGMLDGVEVAFLPRHGKGHRLMPSNINYRANIYAMKKIGVDIIISVSAVGSMKEELKPEDIVVIDQFYDNTKLRKSTFFDNGVVAHVSMADPVCKDLSNQLYETIKGLNLNVHFGGTYICIEGPQFSTRGESLIYRKWGVDVIGMTNMPEAKLAREAGICYATLAFVTDYDCWREEEEDVTVEMVTKTFAKNVANAKLIIKTAASKLKDFDTCKCRSSIESAIITNKNNITDEQKKELGMLLK